jgi:hypothetical protein
MFEFLDSQYQAKTFAERCHDVLVWTEWFCFVMVNRSTDLIGPTTRRNSRTGARRSHRSRSRLRRCWNAHNGRHAHRIGLYRDGHGLLTVADRASLPIESVSTRPTSNPGPITSEASPEPAHRRPHPNSPVKGPAQRAAECSPA